MGWIGHQEAISARPFFPVGTHLTPPLLHQHQLCGQATGAAAQTRSPRSAACALAMQAWSASPWRGTVPQKLPRASVSTLRTCRSSPPRPQRRGPADHPLLAVAWGQGHQAAAIRGGVCQRRRLSTGRTESIPPWLARAQPESPNAEGSAPERWYRSPSTGWQPQAPE